jgi:hypothetical protein
MFPVVVLICEFGGYALLVECMKFVVFFPEFDIGTSFGLDDLKSFQVVAFPLLQLFLLTECHFSKQIESHHFPG